MQFQVSPQALKNLVAKKWNKEITLEESVAFLTEITTENNRNHKIDLENQKEQLSILKERNKILSFNAIEKIQKELNATPAYAVALKYIKRNGNLYENGVGIFFTPVTQGKQLNTFSSIENNGNVYADLPNEVWTFTSSQIKDIISNENKEQEFAFEEKFKDNFKEKIIKINCLEYMAKHLQSDFIFCETVKSEHKQTFQPIFMLFLTTQQKYT